MAADYRRVGVCRRWEKVGEVMEVEEEICHRGTEAHRDSGRERQRTTKGQD
jgi:hypothetical protein